MLENYFTSGYWRNYNMTEKENKLLAPCGLYCGVCSIYKAYKDNDLELKKEILTKLNNNEIKTIEDIACTGCLSDGIVFHFCQACPIKTCIKNKKIKGCYQCKDFPCEIISNWPDPLEKKVMLRAIPSWRELGIENWVAEEEKRYKCPNCGTLLFHGTKKCKNCNFKVNFD